jgi:Glycosyltransferase family 87
MPSSPSPDRIPPRRAEHILGLLGVAIILVGAVLWSARGSHPEKTDFSVTYVGAYIVHHGMSARLYDLSFQTQIRDSLFQHPNPLVFEHPPFEALLLSPLAALPYRTAYMIWGFANATVWLLLIIALRSHLSWPQDDLAYFALWLLFAPLGESLFQGQSSLLVLAFFSIAFIQLNSAKDFAAGLALGFALLKLQFALPFVLIMLLRARWRFLAGFACTASLLATLSLLTVGWSGAISYIHLLLTVGNNPQSLSFGSAVDMPTIHGFMFALFGNLLSHRALNITVALLSIALLGLVARRWKAVNSADANNLMFASTIAACLLASSHMFTHDFSPLILSLFLVAQSLSGRENRTPSALRTVTIATLIVFWTFPVYFICVAWHCMYLMCPVLLAFALSTLFMARRLSSEEKPQPEYAHAG